MNTITDEAGNYREGIAATADPPSEEPRGGDVFFNKQFTSDACYGCIWYHRNTLAFAKSKPSY